MICKINDYEIKDILYCAEHCQTDPGDDTVSEYIEIAVDGIDKSPYDIKREILSSPIESFTIYDNNMNILEYHIDYTKFVYIKGISEKNNNQIKIYIKKVEG